MVPYKRKLIGRNVLTRELNWIKLKLDFSHSAEEIQVHLLTGNDTM